MYYKVARLPIGYAPPPERDNVVTVPPLVLPTRPIKLPHSGGGEEKMTDSFLTAATCAQKHTACDAMLNFAAILTVYTPERSSVERRRCGEREGAERWDAHALAARSASGKEAVEKARKASPVWELRCFKNRANSTVAPRGAWHQNSPIREKRRIPRTPHQASPAACCGCSQQR